MYSNKNAENFNFVKLKKDLSNNNVKRIEYSSLKDSDNLVTLHIFLFKGDNYDIVLPSKIAINLINKLKANISISEKKVFILNRLINILIKYSYYIITVPVIYFLFFNLVLIFISIVNDIKFNADSDNPELSVIQTSNDEDDKYFYKYVYYPMDINIDFNDVYSHKDVKEELKIFLNLLKSNSNNLELPNGIILSGNPGNGKTMLVKAMAKEANVPLISVPGSIFDEIYVGIGKDRVKKIFQLARDIAPCILFIDEIDCVASKSLRNEAYHMDTINQLLVELDGFQNNDKKTVPVLVIAATNNINDLDSAITRAGRLERNIQLFNPSYNDRIEVVKKEIIKNKIPVSDSIDISVIAGITSGSSYAELKECINNAALNALINDKKILDMSDFIHGVIKQFYGTAYEKDISKKSTEILASMQAAKAVVFYSNSKEYNAKLAYISLCYRPKYIWGDFLVSDELTSYSYKSSKNYFLIEIAFNLAPMVITYDINKTNAHLNKEIMYRFSNAKNLSIRLLGYDFFDEDQYNFAIYDIFRRDSSIYKDHSIRDKLKNIPDDQKDRVSNKIDSIINEERNKCKEFLLKNLVTVNKLKDLLIEKKELYSEDIEKFFIENPIIK